MRWLVVCLTVFGYASTANAVVVYDNGAGGASSVTRGLESDTTGPWRFADNLQLANTTHVTQVTWVGMYGDLGTPATDNFTINIHSDNAGLPGSILVAFNVGNSVNRTGTSYTVSGLDVFGYSAEIDLTLLGSTRYYISFVNSTANSDWGWGAINGDPFVSFQSSNGGIRWSNLSSAIFDFQLHAIPEPSAVVIFCLGSVCSILGRTAAIFCQAVTL